MPTQQKTPPKHPILKQFLIVGIIVTIAVFLFWSSPSFLPNYAQQVAKPIEDSLTGAVKMCSSGDSGRRTDNQEPSFCMKSVLVMDK
jgi:hypothetical protein